MHAQKVRILVFSALMAALVCVATMVQLPSSTGRKAVASHPQRKRNCHETEIS